MIQTCLYAVNILYFNLWLTIKWWKHVSLRFIKTSCLKDKKKSIKNLFVHRTCFYFMFYDIITTESANEELFKMSYLFDDELYKIVSIDRIQISAKNVLHVQK